MSIKYYYSEIQNLIERYSHRVETTNPGEIMANQRIYETMIQVMRDLIDRNEYQIQQGIKTIETNLLILGL